MGVGKYIRTDKGYIFHGLSSKQISGLKLLSKQYGNIVKHSKNIIDLIEVGDYVNGLEVLDIYIPSDLWDTIEIRVNDKYTNFITPEDIKSIVTKEQFKLCEYRLEE